MLSIFLKQCFRMNVPVLSYFPVPGDTGRLSMVQAAACNRKCSQTTLSLFLKEYRYLLHSPLTKPPIQDLHFLRHDHMNDSLQGLGMQLSLASPTLSHAFAVLYHL